MNTIAIVDEQGLPVATFTAPADSYAARQLWVFLVEHLQPGLVVGLGDETGQLVAWPSGQRLPAAEYRALLGLEADE